MGNMTEREARLDSGRSAAGHEHRRLREAGPRHRDRSASCKPDDSTLDREAADGLINELDEYAIEEALRLAEAHGGEVTILSMGPQKAAESIRKALSMGADKAVHLLDDGAGTAPTRWPPRRSLAQALARIGFDLVILGSESTDARMGVLAAMLAERLGVPQLSLASKVEIDGTAITINRQADYGYDTVEAACPRW